MLFAALLGHGLRLLGRAFGLAGPLFRLFTGAGGGFAAFGAGAAAAGRKAEVDAVGELYLQLEKFSNLNFTGFNKILKKHDKLLAEVPKYKMISISILTDRLRITCSLARKAIAILIAKGLIKPVTMHSKQQIYTRATNDTE